MDTVEIGAHRVGSSQPCFVIAEAGVNHNGDIQLAFRLIDAAVEAGANAVKFQAFNAEALVHASAPKAQYQAAATGGGESQLEMIRRLELRPADFYQLQAYCQTRGILFLATPFDPESADLLATMKVPAFKMASGEMTNLPFLRDIARRRLPLILSTGMCDLNEVKEAVAAVRAEGNSGLVLLQCVSNYPAAPSDTNLRAMETMRQVFDVPVGYSDHALGNEIALAAVALGACVVEKHLTLEKSLPGPDHRASAEPGELKELIRAIRRVEAALGDGIKRPAPSEANTATVARKSLVAARDLEAGIVLREDMLSALRPGTGLPPSRMGEVLGRRLLRGVEAGAQIHPAHLE